MSILKYFKGFIFNYMWLGGFNPSTQEVEAKAGRSESKASLFYRVSSRTVRARKRNRVSKRPRSLCGAGCVYLLHVGACSSQTMKLPRSGVTGGCETSWNGFGKPNSQPLKEQFPLWTTESSLRPFNKLQSFLTHTDFLHDFLRT